MFDGKLFALTALLCCINSNQVGCIVSKATESSKTEGDDAGKEDNAVAQSIDRDYISGYDDGYGHGHGYGLSSHASYGIPEGYEGYGGYDTGHKHHAHHIEDHHHHHGHHLDDHHHHHHHHSHHKHHDAGLHKALAIKGLLVPLAGVALLGAAAAFVSNPILLQLGVISSAPLGRRKREARSTIRFPGKDVMSPEDEARLNEIKVLERFVAQVPKAEMEAQEKKILASYLSCQGTATEDLCLERLACELHSPEGMSMPTEANVLAIVVNDILANDFVPEATKARVSKAVDRGRKNLGCSVYGCKALEQEEQAAEEMEREEPETEKKRKRRLQETAPKSGSA